MEQQKRDYENMPQVGDAALWIRKSKNGLMFMSGIINIEGKEYKLTLFKNLYKQEGDNKPNYIYKEKKEKKDEQANTQSQQQTDTQQSQSAEEQEDEVKIEDVPF